MIPLAERVLLVPEAAEIVRVSERLYYEAFARGELPGVRIGRRIVVPGALLERFLRGEEVTTTVRNGAGMESGPRRVPPARA